MTTPWPTLVHRTILLAALAATTGCFLRSSTPAIRYFTLAVDAPTGIAVPARVTTSSFLADAGYTGTRIARRPSPYRVTYSAFNRWTAPPSSIMRAIVSDYFSHADETDGPQVFVSGHLHRIELRTFGSDPAAVLELTLVAERGSKRLLERRYDEHVTLDDDEYESLAEALSHALRESLADFAGALGGRIARR